MNLLDKYISIADKYGTPVLPPALWSKESGRPMPVPAAFAAWGLSHTTPIDYYTFAALLGEPL